MTMRMMVVMFTISLFLTFKPQLLVGYAQSEQEMNVTASASVVIQRSFFNQLKHGVLKYGVYGGFISTTFLLAIAIVKGRKPYD